MAKKKNKPKPKAKPAEFPLDPLKERVILNVTYAMNDKKKIYPSELARLMKCSKTTMGSYLRPEGDMKISTVRRFAESLCLPAYSLLLEPIDFLEFCKSHRSQMRKSATKP